MELFIDEGFEDLPYRRLSTSIIQLCKEMLVPEKESFEQGTYSREAGWNACRQHLLKQLGEK